MFIDRVKEIEKSLTYSEKLIARFILKECKNCEKITSSEIAKMVGVGQATVVRFSKKLGYASFKDLVLDIANNSLDFNNSKVDKNESSSQTIERVKASYDANIEEVTVLNSSQDIEMVADMISAAKNIFCFGERSSDSMARVMFYRLIEIGMNALIANDNLSAYSIARNMAEEDVVFVISSSGESRSAVQVAAIAKANHAKVIVITENEKSQLNSLSTISLKCAKSSIYANTFSLINRSSQLFLIDCIFLSIWKKNEEDYYEKVSQINKQIEDTYKRDHIISEFRL